MADGIEFGVLRVNIIHFMHCVCSRLCTWTYAHSRIIYCT